MQKDGFQGNDQIIEEGEKKVLEKIKIMGGTSKGSKGEVRSKNNDNKHINF